MFKLQQKPDGSYRLAGAPQGLSAATELPEPPPPRVRGKQAALPSYLRSAKPNTSTALQRNDRGLANLDITSYRIGNDSREVVRNFRRGSPDLSAAVTSYIRTAVTSGYTAYARSRDRKIDPAATKALHQILSQIDVLNDYTIGYDDSMSIRSLCETWANELVSYGACAGELVLNQARLPDKIQPISTSQIRKYPSKDGKRTTPKQILSGTEIDLNIPTFFMVELDVDLLEAYPISPIEPAVQSVLFSTQLMNDIRRVVRKAIHPRVIVTIDEERFRKTIPQSIMNDQDKVIEYMNAVVAEVTDRVTNLEPEEALVVFDSIGIEVKDHGNTNLSNEYTALHDMADAKMATGAKVLPTVLGKAGATSNVASTEAMMFLKYVEGTVWGKLNEMFSKMLTLAVRLMGYDVIVSFQLDDIELKPKSELEAFRAMKQSRVLMLLSLGLITDEMASIELTGHLPPDGYKPLTGTGFMPNSSVAPAGDGYNGATNKGSTLNQNLSSDAPKGVKSQDGGKAAEGEVIDLLTARPAR